MIVCCADAGAAALCDLTAGALGPLADAPLCSAEAINATAGLLQLVADFAARCRYHSCLRTVLQCCRHWLPTLQVIMNVPASSSAVALCARVLSVG